MKWSRWAFIAILLAFSGLIPGGDFIAFVATPLFLSSERASGRCAVEEPSGGCLCQIQGELSECPASRAWIDVDFSGEVEEARLQLDRVGLVTPTVAATVFFNLELVGTDHYKEDGGGAFTRRRFQLPATFMSVPHSKVLLRVMPDPSRRQNCNNLHIAYECRLR